MASSIRRPFDVIAVVAVVVSLLAVGHASTPVCAGGEVALGMGNFFIEDSQIRAYNAYNSGPPENGRIQADTSLYWSANPSASGTKWFEIDLLAHTVITTVSTQGQMADNQQNKRVLTYSIQYSSDGSTFVDYEESSTVVEFDGNTDEGSLVNNTFTTPIVARAIRIIVLTYQAKPSLRVELYGCYDGRSCGAWLGYSVNYQASSGYFWSNSSHAQTYLASKYDDISVCYNDGTDLLECTKTTGVSGGELDDSAMTASSESGTNYAYNARYAQAGVWMPNSNANTEWLQIDYGVTAYISGFISRGDSSSGDQADTFFMEYSTDGGSFTAQTEFNEPQDIDTLYLYQSPMTAQFIKFTMDSWTNNIAFAVEVYGCFPTQRKYLTDQAKMDC